MWLAGRLMPDFETIADFRKDNGTAIRAVCRQFMLLCRRLNLFTEVVVAVDGSKFKAVNNRDKNFTPNKIQRRMEIEASIEIILLCLSHDLFQTVCNFSADHALGRTWHTPVITKDPLVAGDFVLRS
jgi:hypothetical protein